MIDFPLPLLGFAAWSGTGKTTLLTQLIPLLKANGLRVALVKHSHHDFTIDHKGKDSTRFREAGASQIIIASKKCITTIMDTADNTIEPRLQDALAAMTPQPLDLILVEGFKKAAIAKIELHRHGLNNPYLYPHDKMIIALAEDRAPSERKKTQGDASLLRLDLNQPVQIATFIQQWWRQQKQQN
ncbi:MAG: molybdopterin-guanine dinucleotide biosynthesis protein B [Cocleimonas sp.]|nr:molybdopterin-guanine dinucleotide biosynthesis protein B [Cocleimonas sp.]